MRNFAAGGSLLVFTLLGFFFFPGHTYLQSDTQIYIPMLEHLRDPGVLARDPIATRPHVSFTVYDEVALTLRRWTGAEFQGVLLSQQLLFRFLGLLGVYLIGTALRLPPHMAIFVAGVFSLGATIAGPTVLTIEYEPVPRGFAVPLLLLAVGLAAHGRDLLGGSAAAVAFLYHAPTIAPFWAVYFLLALWPSQPETMQRRIRGLMPLAAAVLLMLALSRMQIGASGTQTFFGVIPPAQEHVQRMRASYNWVSLWAGVWWPHYALLFALAAAAFLRLKDDIPFDLKWFLAGLPLIGVLSVPVSYVLLEKLKWAMIPQFQPARALLFVTAFAVIGAAAAAAKAAGTRRFAESLLWLLVAFAVPLHTRISEILVPDFALAPIRSKVLTLWLLAAAATLGLMAASMRRRWSLAPLALATLLPFWLIPNLTAMADYPPPPSPELDQLSAWARSSVPRDAMFLFPDARRELYPGVFRAKALRAVYTDWKAGGEVNYQSGFAEEWWSRWQATMLPGFDTAHLEKYSGAGIDYIVLKQEHKLKDRPAEFENARFAVYKLNVR